MNPTIGRTVIYRLTDADRKRLEVQQSSMDGGANVSTELPAVVVAVWGPTCVNLRVFTDGAGAPWWKTSIIEGEQQGQWHWPVIEKPEVKVEGNNNIVGDGNTQS